MFDAPSGNGNQTGSLNAGAEVQGKKVPGGGYVDYGDDFRSLDF